MRSLKIAISSIEEWSSIPIRYMLTSRGPAEDQKLTVHVMSEVGVTKSLSQFSGGADTNDIRLVDAGRSSPVPQQGEPGLYSVCLLLGLQVRSG